MLISESYRALNAELHQRRVGFGTSGKRYFAPVSQLTTIYDSRDILDYGCGLRTLEAALGFAIANYDPCIEGLQATPEAHDLVACTDVLEHIEPECLSDVLADLRRVTRKAAFMTIATRPAKKYLADGRNAHLIQEPARWWIEKLWDAGFRIRQFADMGGEVQVVVE